MSKKRSIQHIIIAVLILIFMLGVYYLYLIGVVEPNVMDNYFEKKLGQIVTLSVTHDDYFPSVVDYDKLARVYKQSISEEEFNDANTDAKRLALYRKVQRLTKNPKQYSYMSNASFRLGNYYEVLEVDGVRYRANHVLSIEVNHLTFKPYIKKWSIDILELDS